MDEKKIYLPYIRATEWVSVYQTLAKIWMDLCSGCWGWKYHKETNSFAPSFAQPCHEMEIQYGEGVVHDVDLYRSFDQHLFLFCKVHKIQVQKESFFLYLDKEVVLGPLTEHCILHTRARGTLFAHQIALSKHEQYERQLSHPIAPTLYQLYHHWHVHGAFEYKTPEFPKEAEVVIRQQTDPTTVAYLAAACVLGRPNLDYLIQVIRCVSKTCTLQDPGWIRTPYLESKQLKVLFETKLCSLDAICTKDKVSVQDLVPHWIRKLKKWQQIENLLVVHHVLHTTLS